MPTTWDGYMRIRDTNLIFGIAWYGSASVKKTPLGIQFQIPFSPTTDPFPAVGGFEVNIPPSPTLVSVRSNSWQITRATYRYSLSHIRLHMMLRERGLEMGLWRVW